MSAEDTALLGTIYSPPRARQSWTLKDALPDGVTRYYSLARWALVDALRACGVGRGDIVLMPGLICREVLASVSLLGATAAFYPVSRQLTACGATEEWSHAKAVVAVNYFGFPQDLDPFRRYCARTGAGLIEDNAHGLFSRDASGRLLGGRGDAGVFSFRKTIALPDGSALLLSRPDLVPPQANLTPVRAFASRYRLKQGFRRVARRLGPALAQQTIGGFRQVRQALTGEAIPAGSPEAETHIPVAPNPNVVISHGLTVADPELERQRRRGLYDLAGGIVERVGGVPVFRSLPEHVVPYGFPFFASGDHAPDMAADFDRYGLQLARWPDLPGAVAPLAPEHYRHLFVLPFLW